MLDKLSREQFLELAKTEQRIVAYQEIPGDRVTPISVFEALGDATKGAILLESAVKESDRGRYSLLGFQPIAELHSQGQTITEIVAGKSHVIKMEPFAALRQQFQKLRAKTIHPLSGFTGGMAGFIAYDAIRLFENIPDNNINELKLPDIHFKFYQHGIVFDHEANKAVITTLVEVGADPEQAYLQANKTLDDIKTKILSAHVDYLDKKSADANIESQIEDCAITTDDTYMKIVAQAKHHITIGDAFQIVLARIFRKKFTVRPFDIYRALRFKSPAPYMFYLDYGDYQVVGASPERLVSVHNGVVKSSPLAGTRPRGATAEQDDLLAHELQHHDKEIAEHMMLVDLARNDVGAIAAPGQVSIKELLQVKKFSHVMHLSSTIEGKLADGLDALDALRAALPAGTLSGAPKIRAMEIIDALEDTRRGLYGGAICNLNAQGDLESCIAIRMAMLKDNIATVRAGAGIVFDSIPQNEADETRQKAKTVLDAISYAERGFI